MNNSTKSCDPIPPSAKPILTLRVRNVGPISAFKNKKRAIQDRSSGKMRTMTDAKTQKQMEAITRAIVSELFLSIPTIGDGISTVQHLQSWIALSLPLDDSRQWLPELNIRAIDVDKGNEGCEITIEQI